MQQTVPLIEATRSATPDPRLAELAKAAASLLTEVRSLASPFDLLLGAIHSFYCAEELNYRDRPSTLGLKYRARLISRAEALASARLCKSGRWLAGYYFNSALLRIAASYHQTLKAITGKNKFIPQLIPLVTPTFVHVNLDKVHGEVNRLKHTEEGVDAGRSVTFEESVAALAELVELIKAQKAQLLARYPNP
jgi:hypothetical protein